jgi:bifunctional DNA-binding transcriptional regulator/antitoxin component of YhaV-PrlF toxin-antitoxin module
MARWRDMLNESKRPTTKVSRNGQVVLAAKARRAVGIEPGDLVVSVPVAPGTLLIEKVAARPGASLREQYEREDNPLEGLWGPDPDAWVDELRGQWHEGERS